MAWLVILAALQEPDPVERGWRAIERGEFGIAETLFGMALQRDPRDGDAHAGLGTAFARQGAYDLARPALDRAALHGAAYEGLALERGRAAFFTRDFEGALGRLSEYHARHPDAWEVDELLGLTHFALGRNEEAESHLLEAYRAGGPNGASYLYHLGVIAGRTGRLEESRAYADTLARKYPDSPYARRLGERRPRDATQRNLWAAVRERRPHERSWYAYGTVEGGYDTNPLSIGEGAIVPADLAGRDGFSLGATLGAGWRPLWTEDASVVVDARYSALWRDELAAFDQDLYVVRVEGEHWLSRAVGIGGSGGISHLAVGGADTVSSWSLGAHLFWAQEAWTRTSLRYAIASSEYFLDTLPRTQDLDGVTQTVTASQEVLPPGTDLYLSFGAQLSDAYTEGRDSDATFVGAFVRAVHPVIWKIRAIGGISYVHGDYDHPNSRSTTGRGRLDDRLTFSLRVERPVCDYATVFLSAAWIDSTSNLAAFDYDRNVYALGFDFRY